MAITLHVKFPHKGQHCSTDVASFFFLVRVRRRGVCCQSSSTWCLLSELVDVVFVIRDRRRGVCCQSLLTWCLLSEFVDVVFVVRVRRRSVCCQSSSTWCLLSEFVDVVFLSEFVDVVFEEESDELIGKLAELGLDSQHFRVVPRKKNYYQDIQLD